MKGEGAGPSLHRRVLLAHYNGFCQFYKGIRGKCWSSWLSSAFPGGEECQGGEECGGEEEVPEGDFADDPVQPFPQLEEESPLVFLEGLLLKVVFFLEGVQLPLHLWVVLVYSALEECPSPGAEVGVVLVCLGFQFPELSLGFPGPLVEDGEGPFADAAGSEAEEGVVSA